VNDTLVPNDGEETNGEGEEANQAQYSVADNDGDARQVLWVGGRKGRGHG